MKEAATTFGVQFKKIGDEVKITNLHTLVSRSMAAGRNTVNVAPSSELDDLIPLHNQKLINEAWRSRHNFDVPQAELLSRHFQKRFWDSLNATERAYIIITLSRTFTLTCLGRGRPMV